MQLDVETLHLDASLSPCTEITDPLGTGDLQDTLLEISEFVDTNVVLATLGLSVSLCTDTAESGSILWELIGLGEMHKQTCSAMQLTGPPDDKSKSKTGAFLFSIVAKRSIIGFPQI